jgi:hypothetical protein
MKPINWKMELLHTLFEIDESRPGIVGRVLAYSPAKNSKEILETYEDFCHALLGGTLEDAHVGTVGFQPDDADYLRRNDH